MTRRIESHVARERWHFDGLHDVIVIGGILVEDRQRAVRVRREDVSGRNSWKILQSWRKTFRFGLGGDTFLPCLRD